MSESTPIEEVKTSFPCWLSDAEIQIKTAGFSTKLWVSGFKVKPEDEESFEDPYPPQLLAAYQIFIKFFVIKDNKKAYVHLGAEMQAGKTGVLAGLIRLILSNYTKLEIDPSNIFIITGMADNAWKKQTKKRLIKDVRDGVEHNVRGGLERIAAELHKIHAHIGELRNILVIIDESHIAAADENGPNKLIFRTIENLCPREKWSENNIHILTISATDPAKVLDITKAEIKDTSIVRLQTTPDYQSVEALKDEGRLISLTDDINSMNAITKIREIISHKYDNEPLYHILRPKAVNYKKTIDILAREFPDCDVIPWDSTSKGASAGSGSSISSESDINDILLEAPNRTTFIILKNMFYAAKTLEDEHVGILYDRVGGKDDTNLQSLLGRACGYFKSKRTIIFTSEQTVKNYVDCWKDLCSKKGCPPALKDIPSSNLNKKMSRVFAHTHNGETVLSTTGKNTLSGGSTTDTPQPPVREVANEENFTSTWMEFNSFEDAKKYAKNIRDKQKNEHGFYLSSTTGSAEVQTYGEIMGMKAGKKTANMPWSKMIVGKSVDRLYIGYKNIEDNNSAVFIVRRLTCIA